MSQTIKNILKQNYDYTDLPFSKTIPQCSKWHYMETVISFRLLGTMTTIPYYKFSSSGILILVVDNRSGKYDEILSHQETVIALCNEAEGVGGKILEVIKAHDRYDFELKSYLGFVLISLCIYITTVEDQ